MASTNPPKDHSRARGVDRLIQICRALHQHRGPMSVRELVEATGAARSTVYSLTALLVAEGWLQSDAGGHLFFGRAMYYYGQDYADHDSLIARSRPVVQELARSFNETAQLCALDGNKYTVLLNEHGPSPFVISSEVGVKVPVPWTASGRILLRDMSRKELLELVPEDDFVLPGGARIDVDAFLAEIEQARADGHAITEGLVDSFACCMAAPILDEHGHASATICFTVSRDRSTARRQELIQALMDAGQSLSH